MDPPAPLSQLVAQLLEDQRERWERSERVQVEAYLARHPELASSADALLDLIYNEIVLSGQRGDTFRPNDYFRRFPHLTEQLRRQFAVHQAIEEEDSEDTAPLPEVSGFEVLKEIGSGGMSRVYKARDLKTGRMTAVKVLRTEHCRKPAVRKRFLIEGKAAASLDHPGIVKVHGAGECPAGPYLVMELIEGPSLESILQRGEMDMAQAVALLIPVAEAVHFAHGQNIIHRDLKPANILLSKIEDRGSRIEDGTADRDPRSSILDLRSSIPKITDFGMAKVLSGPAQAGLSSTQQGTVLGTVSYMPPEQAEGKQGKPGPWNDIYSLGAILYALLTGRPPFDEGNILTTLLQVRSAEPPPGVRSLRPDVPQALERICHQCLSKSPADRPVSALALAADLRRCLAALGNRAAPRALLPAISLWLASTRQAIPLEKATTLLGRSPECDIVLTSPEVSRHHCRIVRTPESVVVEDLGSAQGTRLNGRPVTRADLHDGDWLQVPRASFQVRFQGSPHPGKPKP